MNLNQVTLPASDLSASVAFYEQLGLILIVRSPHYARFVCPDGDATFSLHLAATPPQPNGAVIYFECEDLDRRVEALRARGVSFRQLPTDEPWLWREARLQDPDGHELCLFWASHNRKNPPWRITASAPPRPRLDYDASIRSLQARGVLNPHHHPPMPAHVPQPEDPAPSGLSFFRTLLRGADLADLTLPRTFFGRSELRELSFQNTDLTESNLRWNDLIGVDFTDAVLARADLRASHYDGVRFARADLRGADLRRARFQGCTFDGALLDGALLTLAQAATMGLHDAQRAHIAWAEDDGPTPSGG
jgi:catechol 2,3-dioxygenase-like lactoylglutathione lyase family enzyme